MTMIVRLQQWWQRYLQSSFALSISAHLLLLLVLIVNVSIVPPQQLNMDMTPLTDKMPVLNATFIDPSVTQAKFDEAKKQAQAAKAAQQEKARQIRERKRREAAEKKAAEVKAQRLAAEKQAKAKAKAEKIRKQRELERKAQEALAEKEAQAKRAEAQRIAKAEQEAKEKARKAQQQRELEEQIAAEQAQIQAQETQRVMTEKQRYSVLIKSTIQRNLITNAAFKGKKCQLNIRLGIGGVVLKVDIVAGDDALCRAAINAVYKPSNLPVSNDPAVFAQLRDINLTVEQ